MPELPEVETIIRGLKEQFLNKTIHNIKLYYPNIVKSNHQHFIKTLNNSLVTAIERQGKYIFIVLNNNYTIVIHLRMTGQLFLVDKIAKKDKHTHLEIFIKHSKKKVIYRDIRKFGRFELIKSSEKQTYINSRKLATDALLITPQEFANNLQKKKKNIKATLLDQTAIAGLGNIYVDEVLFREKLSPLIIASSLTSMQQRLLLKTIKKVLRSAILKKGTTFSDYITSYGEKGKFQLSLKAYQRKDQPCTYCGTLIAKTKVAGRGTYYCPKCQKL